MGASGHANPMPARNVHQHLECGYWVVEPTRLITNTGTVSR